MTTAMGQQPIDRLLPLLQGVVENGNGQWKSYCPIHEVGGSHDPSLNITTAADGKILLHCFVCGKETSAARFVHAVGLSMSDLYPDHAKNYTGSNKTKREGRKAAEYIYRDAQGCIVYRSERWEKSDGTKTFSQSRPNGQGGWVSGVRGVERVPYRLPELIAAPKDQIVWIVEGERKADALANWGLIATCNVGGAGKWNREFSKRWLKDRPVVILPDNDPVDPDTGLCPGRDHARKVLEATKEHATSVRILELPGLPPKGDIIDWIDTGGTLPQLLELLKQPPRIIIEPEASEITEMDPLDLRLAESRTDIGQGRRIVREHGKFLRYCYPWSKWLIWDGKRWIIDQIGEASRRAKTVADSLWDEMREISRDISEDQLQKIIAFARTCSGATSISRCLECAASEPNYQVMPCQLDSDPWLLNCKNGTVNLQNGELQSHNQGDLITKISPVDFNADATCQHWEKFLLSIFGTEEMVSYIQRLCGYWSTGIIREQSLPILWGIGSNGKTTFLNAFMEVIGTDYTMKAPADFLMAKHNDAHPTDKADLFGRRFVCCSETEDGRRLAESMVKELTGDEPIRARRMREDFWQFNPTHKLALVTNHLPQIRGTDHGIWRRIRRISFDKQFWNPDCGETGPPELMQDRSIKEKLESEREGILAWVVRGAILWNQDGEQAPQSVTDWTNEYRTSQDVLGAFLEECCEIHENCIVKATDIFAAYRRWAESHGEFVGNQRKFGEAMTERKFKRQTNNGTWYRGVRVAIDEF